MLDGGESSHGICWSTVSRAQPRKKESLVRGYMAGRYGAVPFIPGGLLGEENEAETTDREAVLDGEA